MGGGERWLERAPQARYRHPARDPRAAVGAAASPCCNYSRPRPTRHEPHQQPPPSTVHRPPPSAYCLAPYLPTTEDGDEIVATKRIDHNGRSVAPTARTGQRLRLNPEVGVGLRVRVRATATVMARWPVGRSVGCTGDGEVWRGPQRSLTTPAGLTRRRVRWRHPLAIGAMCPEGIRGASCARPASQSRCPCAQRPSRGRGGQTVARCPNPS